jgi:hypothetical protein
MNSKIIGFLSVLVPLAGVQACGQNDTVDLGTGVTGASLADYVDEWAGYTEARELVPGSDRIRVRIGGDGQGTLMLGEPQTYPPATDPDAAYPPGEDPMLFGLASALFRPGMEYPLHGVKVESKRIRFTVSMNDFYKSWCELQTPVPTNNPDVYFCGPNGFSRADDGTCIAADTGAPVSCAKAIMCTAGMICACTATSCTANTDFSVQFDAALREQGTSLEGTFNSGNVRLERQ